MIVQAKHCRHKEQNGAAHASIGDMILLHQYPCLFAEREAGAPTRSLLLHEFEIPSRGRTTRPSQAVAAVRKMQAECTPEASTFQLSFPICC
jgi:hypothetical protein